MRTAATRTERRRPVPDPSVRPALVSPAAPSRLRGSPVEGLGTRCCDRMWSRTTWWARQRTEPHTHMSFRFLHSTAPASKPTDSTGTDCGSTRQVCRGADHDGQPPHRSAIVQCRAHTETGRRARAARQRTEATQLNTERTSAEPGPALCGSARISLAVTRSYSPSRYGIFTLRFSDEAIYATNCGRVIFCSTDALWASVLSMSIAKHKR
mmetsp:Transcript_60776/g.100565  ORF Transcript_60776/g.100565 Transcript_60776/m.100565 type:complete len:210 (-) Transcript_60776:536-1165(-)